MPLRQRDEIGRGHVAVAVLRVPGAQDREERGVADLLPQRLQRHRAAVVDRRVEHLRRARGSRSAPGTRGPRRRRSPPGSRTARRRTRRRGPAAVRSEQIHSDHVAKPSLSQMSGQSSSETESPNHMCAISCTTVDSSGDVPVHGPRLGLERVEDVRRPVHHAADALERVRPVELREQLHSRLVEPLAAPRPASGVGHLVAGTSASAGRRSCTPGRRRSTRRASRRRRWSRSRDTAPSGRSRASATSWSAPLSRVLDQHAVGDRRPSLRHRDRVVERRLVLRRVVDRVPARRALRLVDDERAVVGRDPAVLGLVGIEDRVRVAVVVDGDDEGPPVPDPGGGRDDELLAVAPERRLRAVNRHAADVQAAQVEVEAREVLASRGR